MEFNQARAVAPAGVVGAPPYGRLCAFYFFFFSTLGVLLPYWGLYLESRGLTPARIGALMGVLLASKIVAPNVWGWLADRGTRRMRMVRFASAAAAAAFALVFVARDFWMLAAVMVLFGFFWNAALPQFEAVTLNHLGATPERYPRIRLWGSIGFIVAALAFGRIVARFGVAPVPFAMLAAMVAVAIASIAVADAPGQRAGVSRESLLRVLRRPEVLAFLGACLLMQASHGPYYVFYSIYLKGLDYGGETIGALWALGVIAEVGLFLALPRWLAGVGLRQLFVASFVLTALRWVMIALFAGSLAVLIGAQILHAASFGLYHAVAIQLVHRYFVGHLQGRGQALYSSVSFGAGGALGSFASGALWTTAGARATWLCAAALAVLAAVLVWSLMLRAAPAATRTPAPGH